MKVIKKPSTRRGVCTTCRTEYLIYAKDFKKDVLYCANTYWLRCKYCNKKDVKVLDD